jgi:hypothetical protein|tara:strand:- start:1199 stop:3109 length:1911 start_codon:yes stop_codon:yes gene_type:complete
MADNNSNNNNKDNPRNNQSPLFRRLTRLFSGPIVNYDRPAVIRGTRRDVKKYTFTSSTGKEFKKREYHNPFSSQTNQVLQDRNKQVRYTDFEQMEYTPEIASALDIYADEITTSTLFNPIVGVDCHNREIRNILEVLLYSVLNVDANLFGWARSTCKYGDYYLYLDIDDKLGITNVIPLPVREMERIEGTDPTNPNYVQFYWLNAEGNTGVTFENWQVSHFRIVGSDKYVPYGTSVLEPARRIWRQLTLLEDAMMAYRIVRSPERRVFYIDVGNIPAEDVEQYVEQVKTQMKRNQVVDADSGRVDLRYNAMSIDEDFYIPVRGAANNTRIETLAGGQFTGDIEDVQYLRDKLFSALKVPKAYLAQSDAMEDKTTLSQKDVRFARTIQRLQRVIVSELEKMCIIHLYTLGFRDKDLLSFSLHLNNPSKIAELQELEHLRTKFDIAGAATDGYFSKRWVYENIFKIDQGEIDRIEIERYGDSKLNSTLEAAGTAAAEQASAAAPADTTDIVGDEVTPGEPGEDAAAAETPAGDEAAPEDEGALLAEPASRDDWYQPVTDPAWKQGARKRSYLSSVGSNTASSSRRNLFKGWSGEMGPLSRGVVGEAAVKDDEKILSEAQIEIQKLIKQLEEKDEKTAQ